MARFRFHLSGTPASCRVETEATTVHELGEQLARFRFVTGWLVEEGDQLVEPPVEILVPFQRVLLIASEA